jgi:tetraacyldisaccharide-1-P 4'-kinase
VADLLFAEGRTASSGNRHQLPGFDDHHRYEVPADFAALTRVSQERSLEAWVTTLKDWVKLSGTELATANGATGRPPVWYVRIEARLTGHEHELLRARLVVTESPGNGAAWTQDGCDGHSVIVTAGHNL